MSTSYRLYVLKSFMIQSSNLGDVEKNTKIQIIDLSEIWKKDINSNKHVTNSSSAMDNLVALFSTSN